MTNRPPGASSVRFWYLAGLGVVLEVGHQVLQHLTPSPLLHPGELGRGVAGSLAVDDLGEEPVPEHRTLREDGLLPEVGLVGAHLVPGHHADLVPGRVELDLGRAADHYEGVEEVGLDAAGGEPGVVRLQEDNTHDVVPHVSLSLQLLGVIFLIGKQGGHVEHDLNPCREKG